MNPHADAIEALTALNRKFIEQAVEPLVQDGSLDSSEIFKVTGCRASPRTASAGSKSRTATTSAQLELWSDAGAAGGDAAAHTSRHP